MDPNEQIELLKGMTEEQMRTYLKGFTPSQLLVLARVVAQDLLEMFNRIPELIYDGMECRLPTDSASAREAEQLLERLKSSGGSA